MNGSKLNKRTQKLLLTIARKTLEKHLGEEKKVQFELSNKALLIKRGIFVTLKQRGQLRGCIGKIETNEPLLRLVPKMAILSATQDPRFPPVRLFELKDIDIEISILSPFKRIRKINEIKLGQHGVMVKKDWHQGLFLPQVAIETGWDRETFMNTLCSQKAGLPGDAWQSGTVEIYIFTAQIFGEAEIKKNSV